jgi:hypothetical protein
LSGLILGGGDGRFGGGFGGGHFGRGFRGGFFGLYGFGGITPYYGCGYCNGYGYGSSCYTLTPYGYAWVCNRNWVVSSLAPLSIARCK